MRTRNTRIAAVSILLCQLGTLCADTQWQGTVDDLWSNPANWSHGVPDATQKAQFADPNARECILDVAGATARQLAVGDNRGGTLNIVAGSLTVSDWSIIGYAQSNVDDQVGRLVVTGGALDCQALLFIGFQGEGHMIVDNDAVVDVYNQLVGIGQEATGAGFLYLRGGVMNLWARGASLNVPAGRAHVDFSGGTLTLMNTLENRNTVTRAIADRTMKAYDGAGQVAMDTQSDSGRIIVKGVHHLRPIPGDGSVASAGRVELKWTLPDPCRPGEQVLADVYFGTSPDIAMGASDETPQIISREHATSVVVETQLKGRYYWAVDTYVGSDNDPILSPVFSFTADNLTPAVNAGQDVRTWLTGGLAAVALDATITDDDFLKPYTAKWTVVSEPNDAQAVLANATAEDTIATFNGLGQYVLKLEAHDGEYTGADTIAIYVYADSCEAAKATPGFEPFPGDLNGDCVVNDADLAILKEHWLECNALDCTGLQ